MVRMKVMSAFSEQGDNCAPLPDPHRGGASRRSWEAGLESCGAVEHGYWLRTRSDLLHNHLRIKVLERAWHWHPGLQAIPRQLSLESAGLGGTEMRHACR
jgi:hypothetical protein